MFTETLHADGVLELVIDRPPVNAFSIGLLHDLAARIEAVRDQGAVRAVVLRSAGRGFCGGGDVKEVEGLSGFEGILGQSSGSLRMSLAVLQCAVPVICGVHHYCVGVGVLIAGSADILVASRDTRFVLAEIDNGATAGAVQALKLMPEKRVRAAMMTAEPVLAQELHALGSIYRLVEAHDAVAAEAMAVAARVAGKSAEAMRRLKTSLNNSTKAHELNTLYRAEMSYTYELNIMGEASAGRSAFIDGTRGSYTAD
ncbi:MAG: Enoyl-CoA hydratase/isomerase [Sphingomonas bacterium]|uniref:enoyl-CoA hydratase-related protein n=1 Tax=Sphingomonas bacterium TaxID=1895847 RepID=UPI00260A7137|nr:enoyl-CoA hydratase-related protein [Sphingomonas bacterium]MDB5704214.1 Enoyl-CoA hydratase/isomerase [Sphingomonas bacterium]